MTGGTTNISSSDLPGSSWHRYVYRVMSGSDVDQVRIELDISKKVTWLGMFLLIE